MKGLDFSRAVSSLKMLSALAAEGWFLRDHDFCHRLRNQKIKRNGVAIVASFERRLRRRTVGRWHTQCSGSRAEAGNQCHEGAKDQHHQSSPYPAHQRIEEGFDNRLAGVRVCALSSDHVQIPTRNRVNGNHGLRLLAGQVNALLRAHLEQLFAALVKCCVIIRSCSSDSSPA